MKLLILLASVAVLAVTVYGSSDDGCPSRLQCPKFWVFSKGACYRYFGERAAWSTARSRCRAITNNGKRADLVSIHNAEENDIVFELLHNNAGTPYNMQVQAPTYGAWIGFYQTRAGSTGPFIWSDGSSNTDYTNFDTVTGNPSNHAFGSEREDCAALWHFPSRKTWNDYVCSRAMPYICKVKPSF